jgi:hypothetical protein
VAKVRFKNFVSQKRREKPFFIVDKWKERVGVSRYIFFVSASKINSKTIHTPVDTM